MNRCLDERALVMMAVGEGTDHARAHVASCPSCARRFAETAEDVDSMARVLQAPPPSTGVTCHKRAHEKRAHDSAGRWFGALVAASVLAIVGSQWILASRGSWRLREAVQGPTAPPSLSRYASEVSAALFGSEPYEADAIFASDQGANDPLTATHEVQEALRAASPCTGERFLGAECRDYTSALFF